MTAQIRQFGLPLVLLTASVPALYPSMSLKKPQQDSAVVSIRADGQAFPKKKPSTAFSSTTLRLRGSVQMKRRGGLKLDDLAGSLQIGLANYVITSGTGDVKQKGKIEINAETSGANKKLGLILRGNTQGDTVAFNPKDSKLSSLYFLSLKGEANVTMPAASTIADFMTPP
jgi:hypothetical protein